MARRDTGRATSATRYQQRLSTLAALLGAFLALSAPPSAWGATLTDVRIGKHQEFTRVVLELDALAGYQVFEPDSVGDASIELHLDASAAPREVIAQDGLVRRVEVEPAGSKTVVRVALEQPELLINEMILLAPPRIVFDLRDPAATAATAATAPASRATPRRATERQRESTAPEPVRAAAEVRKPAPIRVVEAQPPAAKSAQTARESAPTATRAEENAAPRAAQQRADATAPAPDSRPDEAPAIPTTGAQEAAAAPDNSGGETPLGMQVSQQAGGMPTTGALTGNPSASPARQAADTPAAPPWDSAAASEDAATPRLPIPDSVRPTPSHSTAARPAAAKPPQTEVPAITGILALVKGNFLYVGAAALALILLLVVVIRRRGEGEDALSPVMAADDLGGQDVLFDDPESVTEPVPAMPTRGASERPSNGAAARAAAGGLAGGIEDRVASLETTLQQLMQAREQIERQLAAQTEELRVQRAAIARTQRAVRTGGSGEEESGATEPVPRPPAN